MKKRNLKIFTENMKNLKVGDKVLFQEYYKYDSSKIVPKDNLVVTKPVYAIYMGIDVYDMAAIMKYVKVPKEWNQSQTLELQEHIEWSNYINILGIWKSKPTWKKLLKAFRKSERREFVPENEITL